MNTRKIAQLLVVAILVSAGAFKAGYEYRQPETIVEYSTPVNCDISMWPLFYNVQIAYHKVYDMDQPDYVYSNAINQYNHYADLLGCPLFEE